VVTALDARLQELQATVAALVDKSIDPESVMAPHPQPEPEPVTVTAPGDLDPDVLEASRTLQMAKRTADALLSEARDEAAEITRVAREQADRELETQRHALASEQLAWEQRRRELITLFEELDDVLGTQRSQADRAHEVVRQVLAGPVADPIVDLPEPTVVNDNGATQPADVVDLADPASVPTPPFGTHDDLSSVPVFTAAPEPSSETGFHIVTAQDETVPAAEPDLQTFGAPPSEAERITTKACPSSLSASDWASLRLSRLRSSSWAFSASKRAMLVALTRIALPCGKRKLRA